MRIPDLSSPGWFLATMLVFFIVIVGRYFLVSGIFYSVFYIWFPEKWGKRKIGTREYKPGQFRKEVIWSLITAVSFSVTAALTVWLWQQGYTQVYTDIHAYPLWWLPLSLLISMLIDETYYYWLHRLLHLPGMFKKIHRIHHLSSVASPWTAFAFHPVEGLLLGIILPLTLMIVPMHPVVILIQLVMMTFSSVISHLDIEIFPRQFHKHPIGKWLIGATHHSLHHRQFKYNYGLYLTCWDKWEKTESPAFHTTFESATGDGQQSPENRE